MPSDQLETLNRAVALLDCFAQDRPELGVREAARLLSLSSSAAGRLMAAMKQLGLLTQDPVSRLYALGPKSLAWASLYSANLDVRTKALPVLEELRASTQETISLYILEGNDRLCVERMESPQNVRIVTRVGKRLPLYAGSAGKVMLAFLPEERQESILTARELAPLTAKTMTDPDVLRQELVKIRRQGYAASDGEWILDAAGVAGAIFDHNGEVCAAISISGPSQRFTGELIEKYAREVIRASEQISYAMGYSPTRGLSPARISPVQER